MNPNGSKWQWRVPRDPATGAIKSIEDGGELGPALDVTVGKFEDEARGCFGVMMKDGVGMRLEPYEYTGRKVLGPTSYWAAVQAELKRVDGLVGAPWAQFCNTGIEGEVPLSECLDGGRYEALYGTDTLPNDRRPCWRRKVDSHLKLCCITDIIDHIIAEGDKAFADTPFANSWMIGHDALGQYWEPDALKYLESKGFPPSRLLCAQGSTNLGTRYAGKLVGNSPELMPLDSNLFADLEYAIKQHCALTHDLHKDDPRKFKLGTPADVWSAMYRSWQTIKPKRIAQDIKRWEDALVSIVHARGAVVPQLDTRHGRRAVPFVPHKDCDESVRVKQEKWAGYAQYSDVPLP